MPLVQVDITLLRTNHRNPFLNNSSC
jgi:hypothetical protein